MERKTLGSADGLCQSIPSRKTLKDLSGQLGCASTQYQSVRAGRDKLRSIMPPATAAEVRQLRHLQREKCEGANTAPGKGCGSIYSNALSGVRMGACHWAVLKMSLKIHLFPDTMTGNTI